MKTNSNSNSTSIDPNLIKIFDQLWECGYRVKRDIGFQKVTHHADGSYTVRPLKFDSFTLNGENLPSDIVEKSFEYGMFINMLERR